MASEVSICNLALGYLGDSATVTSIDPPEGSAQAEHCAMFYPLARDSLLEMHNWGFATRRVQLALLASGFPEWAYAYAQPADAVNIISILPPTAVDDYSVSAASTGNVYVNGTSNPANVMAASGQYVPQPFSCEVDDLGNQIIYTDQENAVLRYSGLVEDPNQFSPLFRVALAWHLASMLAGPIIKGDVGIQVAQSCAKAMGVYLSQAKSSDASQRKTNVQHNVSWMNAR